MKKLLFALFLLPNLVMADTPPQVINKLCSANTFFSQIQPGPNNINCTQPTYSGIANTPTFIDSLNIITNQVSLVNDTLTPGNSKYYGTNSSGTRGYFSLPTTVAWGSITGTLSNQSDLQSALNAKQDTLTEGNLTEATSSVLTITGGTNAVIGSGASIQVKAASTSQSGYLSATDWNTFNNKQTSGSYITALTSDVSASGPGSATATIQSNVVSNAKLAQMSSNTIKGNNTGITANAIDLTTSQVQTMLNLSGTNSGDVTLTAVGSSPSANGASLSGQALTLQPADATHPGLMTTGAQTLAGAKTFSGSISASNLSGTNTGDVTLAAVGAVPNANGASLSSQVLTLQSADGSNPGLITAGTQTIGGAKTFSSTIAASNLSGTNTGDVTIGTANGLSLSSQALSLAAAASGTAGAVSAGTQTITGIKTFETQLIGAGTATNNSAAAGFIGEYLSASVLRASAVNLTSDTAATVTSITLTAGDWDLSGCAGFLGSGTTSITDFQYGFSQTTNSLPGAASVPDSGGQISVRYAIPTSVPSATDMDFALPTVRASLSGSATIYLVVQGTFTVSTLKGYGFLAARRAR